MTLYDVDSVVEEGEPCWGSSGYDDVSQGTQVVVSDESGKTLAATELGPGRGLDLRRGRVPVHP